MRKSLKSLTIAFTLLAWTLAAYSSDVFAPEKADPAAAGMDPVRLARIPAKMKAYVDEGTAAASSRSWRGMATSPAWKPSATRIVRPRSPCAPIRSFASRP